MNSPYAAFLKREVFKTHEYQQFELLFDALAGLLERPVGKVAILERAYIYGGRSLFAGLLPDDGEKVVIDYRPESAEARSNYQGSWLDGSSFDYPMADQSIIDCSTGYRFSFDTLAVRTLLIPNVLHHCRDFPDLMASFLSSMPSLERVFIFDSYLREAHQAPDDFCRYTPAALEVVMRRLGFVVGRREEIGNVFDGILYLVSQAGWHLKNDPRLAEVRGLLEDRLVPMLRDIRSSPDWRPLGRPYASLSTAYALTFER
jgi:hypothetical protein